LLAAIACACGGSAAAPTATPGSIDDVIAAIVLQDVTVLRLTSGDAGCPTSSLHDNAVHLELAIGAQSVSHDVYLLRWRRQADYDSSAADFDSCTAEYLALHPGTHVGSIARAPWRAYGPLWTPQLEQIVSNALSAVGGF
jgi:hypothetical protein